MPTVPTKPTAASLSVAHATDDDDQSSNAFCLIYGCSCTKTLEVLKYTGQVYLVATATISFKQW